MLLSFCLWEDSRSARIGLEATSYSPRRWFFLVHWLKYYSAPSILRRVNAKKRCEAASHWQSILEVKKTIAGWVLSACITAIRRPKMTLKFSICFQCSFLGELAADCLNSASRKHILKKMYQCVLLLWTDILSKRWICWCILPVKPSNVLCNGIYKSPSI